MLPISALHLVRTRNVFAVFVVVGIFISLSGLAAQAAAEGRADDARCPYCDAHTNTISLLQQRTSSAVATRATFGAGSEKAASSLSSARGHQCTPSGRSLPLSMFSVVVTAALVLLGVHVHGNTIEQAARSVYLLVNFVLVLNYTFVILDSYDLCATLGMSQSDSGRMVGNYMLGFCLGAFLMWGVARRIPGLWKSSPRRVLAVGLTCQLIGTTSYAAIASVATQQALEADYANIHFGVYEAMLGLRGGSPRLAFCLMAARFIAGMGSGICQQFYVASMLHLTPVAERSEHTTRWVFSGMLAIGGGPMIAAGLESFNSCADFAPDFTPVGLGQVMIVLGAFAAVLLYHPNLEHVQDRMEKELVEDAVEPSSPGAGATSLLGPRSISGLNVASRRITLVCGCLVMGNLRAFGISAIEVVTASLLEDSYQWDQRKIGLVVGLIFLCCIPVRLLHKSLGEKMPVVAWIRIMSVIAILGCFLLFRGSCSVLNKALGLNCAGTLVLAGVVLFPAFYMGEALACGIMHQHVLPTGSRFDGNHSQLWYNLAQGLGRFLGPWISRWATDAFGQDFFAMQQMAVTCIFLLIFESMVRPFMRAPAAPPTSCAAAGKEGACAGKESPRAAGGR